VFELLLEDNDCMEEDTPTPPADVLSAPAAKGEGVHPENSQEPAVAPIAAHDDVSGGRRRLRVSTSNPDAPAQPKKKSRAKGKAGSGAVQAEVPLTVDAILRGVIQRPKPQIYHRRQQLPALKKNSDNLTVLNEEEAIAALSAAERLRPAEILRLPDHELGPSLQVILRQMQASELPKETMFGLVRRQALKCIENPQSLVATLWPTCHATTATTAPEFDPYHPKMRGP